MDWVAVGSDDLPDLLRDRCPERQAVGRTRWLCACLPCAARASGLTYPAPIVDVAEAARAARQAIWAVRQGRAFREEAARVVEKHAFRKDAEGHVVNDRAPKTRTAHADPRQLGFGF